MLRKGEHDDAEAVTTPTIRLAHCGPPNALVAGLSDPEVHDPGALARSQDPTVRLAATNAMMVNATASGKHRYPHHKEKTRTGSLLRPALLVSYVYLPPFLKNRHLYHYRDWVLDSGAFSAHASGNEIPLQGYIDTCKHLMETDPTLTEIFSLDVIGDWRGTKRNTEEMWRQGVPAIPCFHLGEPWDVLKGMAKDYPKIALGGCARMKVDVKTQWALQCFARVWPKKIHGFGFGSEKSVLSVPFHSTDATNWEMGPCAFGSWKKYGKMSVRGSNQNLRGEVEWYLKLEEKARFRWRKEMALLDKLAGGQSPTVYLAAQQRSTEQVRRSGLSDPPASEPSVRLAYAVLGGVQRAASAFTPPGVTSPPDSPGTNERSTEE